MNDFFNDLTEFVYPRPVILDDKDWEAFLAWLTLCMVQPLPENIPLRPDLAYEDFISWKHIVGWE